MNPLFLYHLATDLGETKNVAGTEPTVAAALEKLLTTARTDAPDFPLNRKAKAN